MRANSVTKEPAIQSWWAENGVYEQIASREGANGETFTLHDGPPYANGGTRIESMRLRLTASRATPFAWWDAVP